MQWQVIVALIVATPVILLPVAFVWYLNVGGVFSAVKEKRDERALEKAAAGEAGSPAVATALDDSVKQ